MTKIFVFGSNLAGRHGKGAALAAKTLYNAQTGIGFGPTGNAYAIPTKDEKLRVLSISEIYKYVKEFIEYAKAHPELKFIITPIGTGLAGYKHSQIAPMFRFAPNNCEFFCTEWMDIFDDYK